MNTIGTRIWALSISAQRPKPVTSPAVNAMAPIDRDFDDRRDEASWMSVVETIESPKPTSIVFDFTRHGPGKSLMLAPIAPSVAG